MAHAMTVHPKVIYLADRSRRLAPDQFKSRWLQHGQFAMSLPIWRNMWKYAQCDPVAAGNYAPFCDAIGLVWYVSQEALESIARQPSLREPILADELETFSGPVRQRAMLTEEGVLVDGLETDFKLFVFEREASDDRTASVNHMAVRVVRSNVVINSYTSTSALPYKSVLEFYFVDAKGVDAAAHHLEFSGVGRDGSLVIGARERRLYGPID